MSGFPQLFLDVMSIRHEVFVLESPGRGGLKDIAPDLEDDSVSLHWVMYFTDYIDSKNIILPGIQDRYEKVPVQIPVATIKARPVIGMVCHFTSSPHLLSSLQVVVTNSRAALTGTA